MKEKLDLLIDKKFNYKDKIITITKWKKVSGIYVIFTDKRTFNFLESEIEWFIQDLSEVRVKVKEGVLEKRQLELKKMEHTPNTLNTPNTLSEKKNDLTDILYDTINKVKEDKNYIGQANAICNVVSQMINIKKLELQLKK